MCIYNDCARNDLLTEDAWINPSSNPGMNGFPWSSQDDQAAEWDGPTFHSCYTPDLYDLYT